MRIWRASCSILPALSRTDRNAGYQVMNFGAIGTIVGAWA